MNDVKISIIIPVYNIENYVEDCILSVLSQTFKEIEVILIDDGSCDESGKICDKFAEENESVRVYHKANGGLSDARNFGIGKARGKYVLFVDGDDKISQDACEVLYSDAEKKNADMVIGCAELEKPSSAMERYEKAALDNFEMHKTYTGIEYLFGCLEKGALRVEVWRCLYLRDFLSGNTLLFKKGIAHEDEEFTPRALLAAQRVVLTEKAFYHYNNVRQGSVMNKPDPKKAQDKISIYNEQLKLYKQLKPRRLRRLLEDDIAWKYMDCYKVYGAKVMKADKFLPIKCAYSLKRRIKATVFAISPELHNKIF